MTGDRNRLISFWKPSGALDAANQPVKGDAAWVLHRAKWGNIKTDSGLGTVRAAATAGGVVTPLVRYSCRINYDRTITEDMQARTPEGDRFNIVQVKHDLADREYTDVIMELGGANG